VADDLRDVGGDADELGKPVGRDAALGRRSAVAEFGVAGAIRRLERLVAEAAASIPHCEGAADLQALIRAESRRFVPEKMARVAA
jgi:geranylgeranyl diphosphate synthase type II